MHQVSSDDDVIALLEADVPLDDDLALINAWFEVGVPHEEIEARIKARVQRDYERKLEEIEKTSRQMKRRARRQEVQMDAWLRRYAKHEGRRVVGGHRLAARPGRAPRRACNARTAGSRRGRAAGIRSGQDPGEGGLDPPDDVPATGGWSG